MNVFKNAFIKVFEGKLSDDNIALLKIDPDKSYPRISIIGIWMMPASSRWPIARQRERGFRECMQKHITPEDRLDILRAGDTREWTSLDDRRICTRCNKFISGRQVEIQRDPRGRVLLHCPTPDCLSTVGDWFYVRNDTSREKAPLTGTTEFSFAF